MPSNIPIRQVMARERLAVTSGAVKTLTAATYLQSASPTGPNQYGVNKRCALAAMVVNDSGAGAIHYTIDGTDPTSGVTSSDVGNYLAATDVVILDSLEAIIKFKAKALSADGIIEVTYFR